MVVYSIFLIYLKTHKKLFFIGFLLFSILITSSCNLGGGSSSSLSSNIIDVFIAPIKEPEVFLLAGGSQICRRSIPDESIYGLDPIETDEQEEEGGEQDQQQEALRARVISVDVDENWFKTGLVIVNKSTDYYLIVDQIVFVMSAPWGNERLTGRAEISSGYCQTDPLYIVPPTPKNVKDRFFGYKYEPFQKYAVNNLTLFVSGVPVPDGPPKREGDEAGGSNTQGASSRGQQSEQVPRESEAFIIDSLPSYRVQMLMKGYFVDKQRSVVSNFTKKVKFSLSSSFYR